MRRGEVREQGKGRVRKRGREGKERKEGDKGEGRGGKARGERMVRREVRGWLRKRGGEIRREGKEG